MAQPAHQSAQPEAGSAQPPIVVKKYANRRLYNTESSSYITLDDLARMVKDGREFVVYDAKTGEDITRGVLTQIIVEAEGKGQNLLPTNFLRQLIGFYGGAMEGVVPRYLDEAMEAFSAQQERIRDTMQRGMGGMFPFPGIEEAGRRNMEAMERVWGMFSPFQQQRRDPVDEVAALKAEVEALRRELAAARARR